MRTTLPAKLSGITTNVILNYLPEANNWLIVRGGCQAYFGCTTFHGPIRNINVNKGLFLQGFPWNLCKDYVDALSHSKLLHIYTALKDNWQAQMHVIIFTGKLSKILYCVSHRLVRQKTYFNQLLHGSKLTTYSHNFYFI